MSDLEYIPWDKLRGKSLLITGATGLIGSALVDLLVRENDSRGLGMRLIALVRDEGKARRRLARGGCVSFVQGAVEALPDVPGPVDFVVHAASVTSSRAFVEQPAEVIETSVIGTSNVLRLAREKGSEGLAYLSSMEVYGHPEKGHRVSEGEVGRFEVGDARSSYPLSKIMCECLCLSYAREHGVPANVLRLTQTFGPGARYDDGRVFAEFARCAVEKRDIVLKTDGRTERSYLYTEDAATAVLAVLLRGGRGAIYNAANEDTYCSIADMAELVAGMCGIRVRYDLQDAAGLGYASTLYMDLDAGKLRALGWRPTVDLAGAFGKLIESFAAQRPPRRAEAATDGGALAAGKREGG